MLFTQVLLPLLPLASAISLHGLARRSHATLAVRERERAIASSSSGNSTLIGPERRSKLITAKGGKAKRVVRRPKNKRACSRPPATSIIGNDKHAVPTASPSPTSTAPPPPPSPTDHGWQHVETWVSVAAGLGKAEER